MEADGCCHLFTMRTWPTSVQPSKAGQPQRRAPLPTSPAGCSVVCGRRLSACALRVAQRLHSTAASHTCGCANAWQERRKKRAGPPPRVMGTNEHPLFPCAFLLESTPFASGSDEKCRYRMKRHFRPRFQENQASISATCGWDLAPHLPAGSMRRRTQPLRPPRRRHEAGSAGSRAATSSGKKRPSLVPRRGSAATDRATVPLPSKQHHAPARYQAAVPTTAKVTAS